MPVGARSVGGGLRRSAPSRQLDAGQVACTPQPPRAMDDPQPQHASPRLLLFQQTTAAGVASATSTSATLLLLNHHKPNAGVNMPTVSLRPVTPPIVQPPICSKQDPHHVRFTRWQRDEALRKHYRASAAASASTGTQAQVSSSGGDDDTCREEGLPDFELERDARRQLALDKAEFVPHTNVDLLERNFSSDIWKHVDMSKRRVQRCRTASAVRGAASARQQLSVTCRFLAHGKDVVQEKNAIGHEPLVHRSEFLDRLEGRPVDTDRAVFGVGVSPPRPASARHATPGTFTMASRSVVQRGHTACSTPALVFANSNDATFVTSATVNAADATNGASAVVPPSNVVANTSGSSPVATGPQAPASAAIVPWTTALAPYETNDVLREAFRPHCAVDRHKYAPPLHRVEELTLLQQLMSSTDGGYYNLATYRPQDSDSRHDRVVDVVNTVVKTPLHGEDGEFQHMLFRRMMLQDARDFYVHGSLEVIRWSEDRVRVNALKSDALEEELFNKQHSSQRCTSGRGRSAPSTHAAGQREAVMGPPATPSGALSAAQLLRNVRHVIATSIKERLVQERSAVQKLFFEGFSSAFVAHFPGGLSAHATTIMASLSEMLLSGKPLLACDIRRWILAVPADGLFFHDVVSICFSLCSGLMLPHALWLTVLRDKLVFAVATKSMIPLPDDISDVQWVLRVKPGDLGPQCIRWLCSNQFHALLEDANRVSSAAKEAVLHHIASIPAQVLLHALLPLIEGCIAAATAAAAAAPSNHSATTPHRTAPLHAPPPAARVVGARSCSVLSSSSRSISYAEGAVVTSSADGATSDAPSSIAPRRSQTAATATSPAVIGGAGGGSTLRLSRRQVAALPFPPCVIELLQRLREVPISTHLAHPIH